MNSPGSPAIGSTAADTGALPAAFGQGQAGPDRPVRVGIIGCGARGAGLTGVLLSMPDVRVPAVCDPDPARVHAVSQQVAAAGRPEPAGYGDGPEAWRRLLERDDLDAVVIASRWDQHAEMAVEAMKAGKYAAVEVPCALSLEECRALVETHEATGVPCMMLENWSYRRDNLAVLNMIRRGLFGEMVHCHCAHSHDCIDHWFFDSRGNDRWPARFLIEHNRDQYPTHALGPVLSWLDINVGDAFATITSAATASRGINAHFARRFGPDHPGARRRYAQGDIVTSVIRTQRGRTIVVNYDMQLPRPYDNRWMVQGTLGLYREDPPTVYIVDRSPEYHQWEPFAGYQKDFDHVWWREHGAAARAAGHEGTDYLELRTFLDAVRAGTQTPIDVYDSVTMSMIIPLSERSIAAGGAPVECPDFTSGRWPTRRPTFAVEA